MPRLAASFDPRLRVSASAYRRAIARAAPTLAVLLCLSVWLGACGWRVGAILVAALGLVVILALAARTAGRLRDRGRSTWWLAPYGLFHGIDLVPTQDLEQAYPVAAFAIALLALGFVVWFLVETWIRPGTPGPNRFGPSPALPAGPSATSLSAGAPGR